MYNFSIQIDWIINSSELQPNEWLNKTLGYIHKDFWCFKILKKPRKKSFVVLFAIERKKVLPKITVHVKLHFSNPETNLQTKCIKKFNNPNTTLIGRLKHCISEMFDDGKKIAIKGEFCISENMAKNMKKTLITLSTDMSQLCCNQKFSDVIIRCGSEVFPAHKNILTVRSPVFANMLQNTSSDTKIDINDVNPDVFKNVLSYIYSGKIESLTYQSACDLLGATDKFCLNELKIMCLNCIKCSLTVENVFDCFYKFEELQLCALQFMAENLQFIKNNELWLEFNQKRPDLAIELLSKSDLSIKHEQNTIDTSELTS